MNYDKRMLSKSDIKVIKDLLKPFATKGDLKNLATKDDLRKMEKRLDKKFIKLFDFLDKDVMNTNKRLKTMEENLGIPPVSQN